MLFIQWLQFLAMYIITKIALYTAAGRFKDTAWGPSLALVA